MGRRSCSPVWECINLQELAHGPRSKKLGSSPAGSGQQVRLTFPGWICSLRPGPSTQVHSSPSFLSWCWFGLETAFSFRFLAIYSSGPGVPPLAFYSRVEGEECLVFSIKFLGSIWVLVRG